MYNNKVKKKVFEEKSGINRMKKKIYFFLNVVLLSPIV